MNLLIVDDDPIIRESYAALLRAEGYRVSLTNDGSEALSRLLQGTVDPSAILLDFQMPRMDGLGFRAAQLDKPTIAAIPVVMCSGAEEPRDATRALGVSEWLPKPVDGETLLKAIRRCAPPPSRPRSA